VVNGFFTVTWLLAPRVDEQFWPAWNMLLVAVPLGLHATAVVATWPPRAPADSTGSREATTDGKVVEHDPGGLEV
jgi:hypothetical protein